MAARRSHQWTLNGPQQLALDVSGNLFIADQGNHRVREVKTNGVIITVAGSGGYNYNGDGIPATNANINVPNGVAVDANGNLFIADDYNYRVREVGTNGIITTVAGNGSSAYSGDGGPATNAGISYPTGLALDASGNLFVGDGHGELREVSSNGIITTCAGNASLPYSPYSGDGGPATNAGGSFADPFVDANGNVFVADYWNNRIHDLGGAPTLTLNNVTANNAGYYQVVVIGPSGSVTSSVAFLNVGLPTLGSVAVNISPVGAVNAGAQWALDGGTWQNSGVLISNVSLGVHTVLFSPITGWITPNSQTVGVVAGQTTNVSATYVQATQITQQPTNQVVMVGGAATFSVSVSGSGPFTYQWLFNSNNITTNGIITTVAGNGTNGYSGDGGVATGARLYNPDGVAGDAFGNFFIADLNNNRIRKVDRNGIITTVAGGGTGGLGDGGAATNATLNSPRGLVLDANGNLFIGDSGNNRVRKVSTNGIIMTFAGNGTGGFSGDGAAATNATLNDPEQLALDGSGNLFIAGSSKPSRP